jgi:hypothetical protein
MNQTKAGKVSAPNSSSVPANYEDVTLAQTQSQYQYYYPIQYAPMMSGQYPPHLPLSYASYPYPPHPAALLQPSLSNPLSIPSLPVVPPTHPLASVYPMLGNPDNKNLKNINSSGTTPSAITHSSSTDAGLGGEDDDDDIKGSKKRRTNYRRPENAAKLNAAVNALIMQKQDPNAPKDIRSVSKIFNIPYNTLRDNYLR